MLNIKKAAAIAVITGFAGTLAAVALAEDTNWQKDHPRREQVNKRLKKQNRRIHKEQASGEITPQQARALHTEDHQIRQEERDMASQNGSHLTGQEQRTLNRQENGVSNQIGK